MAFLRKNKSRQEEKTDATQMRSASVAPNSGSGNKTGVLLRPHITEKTAAAARARIYGFAVSPDANKSQVKKAVESKYGVKVTAVRVVNIRGKELHRGKQVGWKQGMKKAYATLAEGQAIEIQ